MSTPVFSTNPVDYPNVAAVISRHGLTPVLVVIGGSHAINTTHISSDLDIWGVHLEDEPEEISFGADVRLSVLGSRGTQFISYSLAKGRREAVTPINDPPRRIWIRENFLTQPRIFDSSHAEVFRKELLEVPVATVSQYYLEAGDWYATIDTEKMNTHAVRMYLTGVRFIQLGDLIIDYQVLIAWAGISSVADARQLLVSALPRVL